jgi:hypothetical protein
MKIFCLTGLFLILASGVFGQSFPQDQWRREGGFRTSQEMTEIRQRRAREELSNRLGSLPSTPGGREVLTITAFPGTVKLSKSDKKLVAPEAEFSAKYQEFLKQPKTGLLRLLAFSCSGDENGKDCKGNGITALGSAYSFRRNEYQLHSWADLWLNNNFFVSDVLYGQGWLVALGDVEIENLSLTSKGADFLSLLTPASDLILAENQFEQSVEGIEENKLVYRKFLPVNENTTYVLRSVAYRGKFIRSINGWLKRDMTKGDTRADVIIAFRVIKRDAEGNVTLVWKELSRKDAPELDID